VENKPLAVYDEFRAQIAELSAHNNTLVFDYASPSGNKEARSHIYKLRQTKAALDKARKAAKEESLEYGRRVDSEAKAIAEQLEDMIAVHQKPLDEIEAKEKARVEKLQADLQELMGAAVRATQDWMTLPLDAMRDRLTEIEADDYSESRWQEFLTEALIQKDKTIAATCDAIARREKYDAEQAELAKLRAQAEEQAKKDRDAQIAKEAADRATREAEAKAQKEREAAEQARRDAEAKTARDKQEAADKAQREKDAADKKLLEEKLRNERLEREKAEAEQRAKDAARETEARLKREAEAKAKAEADALAKREADKKHRAAINNAALAAFVKGGLSEAHAKKAIELIASKAIPNVTIGY
jgi:colicin import membrane protein